MILKATFPLSPKADGHNHVTKLSYFVTYACYRHSLTVGATVFLVCFMIYVYYVWFMYRPSYLLLYSWASSLLLNLNTQKINDASIIENYWWWWVFQVKQTAAANVSSRNPILHCQHQCADLHAVLLFCHIKFLVNVHVPRTSTPCDLCILHA